MKIRPIYKIQDYNLTYKGVIDIRYGLPSGHIEKGDVWIIDNVFGQIMKDDMLIANVDYPEKKYGDWVVQRTIKQDYLVEFK